jgi:hypothetical protein
MPSWNEGLRTRSAIVDFVEKVTNPDSPDFVPVEKRIAVFDNDGTLISEQPIYIPVRLRHRPHQGTRPETSRSGRDKEPFKSVLEGRLTRMESKDDEKIFS